MKSKVIQAICTRAGFTTETRRARRLPLSFLMVVMIAMIAVGCGKKQATQPTPGAGVAAATPYQEPEYRFLRVLAAAGANEALIEHAGNAAALQEVTDALDVFCGKGEADSLFIIEVVRRLPDRLHISERTKRRLSSLAILVEELGGEINPSDYVAWGGVGCAVRDGIQRGLGPRSTNNQAPSTREVPSSKLQAPNKFQAPMESVVLTVYPERAWVSSEPAVYVGPPVFQCHEHVCQVCEQRRTLMGTNLFVAHPGELRMIGIK